MCSRSHKYSYGRKKEGDCIIYRTRGRWYEQGLLRLWTDFSTGRRQPPLRWPSLVCPMKSCLWLVDGVEARPQTLWRHTTRELTSGWFVGLLTVVSIGNSLSLGLSPISLSASLSLSLRSSLSSFLFNQKYGWFKKKKKKILYLWDLRSMRYVCQKELLNTFNIMYVSLSTFPKILVC